MFSTAVSTMLTMVMTAAKISNPDMVAQLRGCAVERRGGPPSRTSQPRIRATSFFKIHHDHRVPRRLRVVVRSGLDLISNDVEIAVTAREDATAIRQVVDL